MSNTFSAHYDGRVIIPDQPVSLPIGQKLQLRVEAASEQVNQFADLANFAADLPGSPGDLSIKHDDYLYGSASK
jgi:hypothetical protein